MGNLIEVRQVVTLEWKARDVPDGPFFQGTVTAETQPIGEYGENTAVFLRDKFGRVMHAYRVRTAQASLARESARDIVAAAVAGIQGDYAARHVEARLEARLKTVAQETGYDDLCVCSAGSPENYDGPDRDCPMHGEKPLVVS